ncbi:MAG: hypothetical protein Q4B28_02025 [bacterium]|nr:hypothetical protein [bacterium]
MQPTMYLPSSSERKRAITAYLLVGVLFFSGKEDLSVYEYFHYRQAIGWYATTMFFLLMWLFVFWIPLIRVIPFLLILSNLIWMGVLVFMARKGKYATTAPTESRRKRIYADIGSWILHLFDIKKNVYGDIALDNNEQITTLEQTPPQE